ARPEPAAAHLVRIGIASHPIGNIGDAAWMRRGGASRKPCDREIEAAPEEVNGTDLAVKARAKAPEHIRGRNEDAPASVHVLGIVGSMSFVDIEGYLALDFHRFAVDPDRHPDRSQRLHHGTIKIRDRHRSERDAAPLAATRL